MNGGEMANSGSRQSGSERWWRVTRPMDGHVTWSPEDPSDRLVAAWENAKVEGPFVPEAELERLREALRRIYEAARPVEGRRWLGREARLARIAGEALGLPTTSAEDRDER